MLPVQDAATVNAVTKTSKEKRPRSAYSMFQKESGPQILAKHKGVSIGDRSKILAAEWKKVSEAEKARQASPGKQSCPHGQLSAQELSATDNSTCVPSTAACNMGNLLRLCETNVHPNTIYVHGLLCDSVWLS